MLASYPIVSRAGTAKSVPVGSIRTTDPGRTSAALAGGLAAESTSVTGVESAPGGTSRRKPPATTEPPSGPIAPRPSSTSAPPAGTMQALSDRVSPGGQRRLHADASKTMATETTEPHDRCMGGF